MFSKLVLGRLSEEQFIGKNYLILDDFLSEVINTEDLKYKIISLPTLSYNEYYKIFSYLNDLSENIILELKEQLNLLNNVDYHYDDWKIIIGPWLNNFLKISYNRFYKLKKALNENDISDIIIYICEDENFVPTDNLHLNTLANNCDWNAILYSKIVNFLNPNHDIKIINLNTNFSFKKKISFKIIIKSLLSNFLGFFTKKNDALIVNSYLPLFENIKLFFYLKQFPTIWFPPSVLNKTYSKELRSRINLSKSKDDYEKFVKKMIPKLLPTCHLESFDTLSETVKNLKLPQKPKFIFTSNNYEYDEIFKLYVVNKKQKNNNYIIGQHGNYLSSIDNIFFKESHSANFYLDWGKNGFDINENGFNLKLVNKNLKNNKADKILLLDSPYGTNNKIYSRIEENINKEKFLFTLLSSIDIDLHKKIILKLHSSFKDRDKLYISRIKSIAPNIKIVTNDKIFNLYKKSRCIIHTYNSTGIYESMGLNIPTFCIWPNKLEYIPPELHKFYKVLEDNFILFSEPKYLGRRVNLLYKNIDRWWLKDETVYAINQFLEKFSNIPKRNSTRILANKLLKLVELR